MSSPADPQNFWLQNPVARSFLVSCNICRFNDPRNYPFAPSRLQKHEGIDLAGTDPAGQPVPVLAAQRGVVDKIAYSARGYGHYVRVRHRWHNGTYVTWYAHLSQVLVKVGDFVNAGDRLGTAGNTGNAIGKPHLHLTLQLLGGGKANYVVSDVIDPEPYFILDTPPAMHEMTFAADITIEDGTKMMPGQAFIKTWRIRNTGNTTWNRNFRLVHTEGARMGAPEEVGLPPAGPGQLVEVSVPFTAPETSGTYYSTWRPRDDEGRIFNFHVYTEIEVARQAAFNQASWVADVTVPDGMHIPAGQTFLKTWRVRNTGTIPWINGYRLAFVEDEQLEGPDAVPLPPIAPGAEGEVSVELKAPQATGTYRSSWKPVTPGGQFFDHEQHVEIYVAEATGREELNEARYEADITILDGTALPAGQHFTKTWRIRNSGTTTWGAGYELAYFSDHQLQGPAAVPLPATPPGFAVEVSVPLVVPGISGSYVSTWKPRDPQGNFFEFPMFAEIVAQPADGKGAAMGIRLVQIPARPVVGTPAAIDMLDYVCGDGRLYLMRFNWYGGGEQWVQTQPAGGRMTRKFYIVKGQEWEELWYDDQYIFRGVVTTAGGGNMVIQNENGHYGSRWIPRQMVQGCFYQRQNRVNLQRKNSGRVLNAYTQITWSRLEAIHRPFKLSGGIELADAVELATYLDYLGRPARFPIERAIYARQYGLVAWQGRAGQAYLIQGSAPGTMPDLQREEVSSLL